MRIRTLEEIVADTTFERRWNLAGDVLFLFRFGLSSLLPSYGYQKVSKLFIYEFNLFDIFQNFFSYMRNLNCYIKVLTLSLHIILSLPIPTHMGYANPEILLTYVSKCI